MLHSTSKIRLCALLLGLVFLAAQFHFCADLTSSSAASHFCPFCATTGAAIAPFIPTMSLAPSIAAAEMALAQSFVSAEAVSTISSRAPPAL